MAVAGLSALVAGLASIYYYNREMNLRKRVRLFLKERERIPRETAGKVIDLSRFILDNLAISGENPQLLARRLQKAIFAKEEEDGENGLVASVQEIANYYFYGIADHLKEEHPDMNEDEVRICCFICMDMPNHSLQYLFGYGSTAYLYNQRCRIRRKLEMDDPDITLKQYLDGMVEQLKRKKEEELIFSTNKRFF